MVHDVNQFFGQIGGEDKAGVDPQVAAGPVGPGRLLQQMLADRGDVVATAICGDNFFAENPIWWGLRTDTAPDRRMGAGIAEQVVKRGVRGVILTST
ncbi:MAG: glycine/betaine/sarcosine/D-proline family reductase selenoprotein B [Chloroflexi bacterium]|nr:glycine/betaine/sarcosine/D-proline family reductase selenoprotein B [Chloroflexota bacterium]